MEAKRTRDPRSLQDLDLRGEKAHRHGKTCLWAMTQPVHDTTGAHRVVLYLTENIWRAPEVRRWPRTWGKGWEGATNTKRWPALRQERSTRTVVFRGFTDGVKDFCLCPTHGSTGNQLRVFIKEYHDTCVFRTAALAARWGMIRSAQGCGPIRTVTVQVQI